MEMWSIEWYKGYFKGYNIKTLTDLSKQCDVEMERVNNKKAALKLLLGEIEEEKK